MTEVEGVARPSSAYSWASGWAVGIALVVVVPLFLTELTFDDLGRLCVVLAAVVTAWSGIRLALLIASGTIRLVAAIFWVFVYVWFGVTALAQAVANRFPIPGQVFSDSIQTSALEVIIVGLVGYEIGSAMRRAKRDNGRRLPIFERVVAARRVWVIAGIGLMGSTFAILRLGKLVFSSRYTAQTAIAGKPVAGYHTLDKVANKPVGLIQVMFIWVPAFVALYLLLSLRREYKAGRRSSKRFVGTDGATALLLALMIANVISSNPIGNPRYRSAGVLLSLVAAVTPLTTARRFRVATLSFLVGVFLVYPLGNAFRYDKRTFAMPSVAHQLVDSPDFGMYQQELNAQIFVRDHGHTFGRQFAGAAFVFFPRALWRGKPTATGNLISRTDMINASASLWAVAYVDGGFAGVFAFFLAYGWLTSQLDLAFLRTRAPTHLLRLGAPVFAAFQVLLLRGDPQPAVGELAPLFAFLFLATRPWRTPAEDRPGRVVRLVRQARGRTLVSGQPAQSNPR